MEGLDDKDGRRGRSPAPALLNLNMDSGASGGIASTDGGSRSTSAMTSPLSFDVMEPNSEGQQAPKPLQLNNNSYDEPVRPTVRDSISEEGTDNESAIAEPFERHSSPTSDLRRNKGAVYEKVGDQGVCKMHKFSLYETATRYYIVGGDIMDQRFRILTIDRTADAGELSIAEDDIVYTKKETSQLLNALDDGNKSTGGLKFKCSTWGLLGFIRFTGSYYMLLITKRSQVAMIGGHYVYQVDGTELVPLTTGTSSRFKPDVRNAEETRFLGILNNLDLSRSFYFSYSYDITRTLQHNIVKEREVLAHNIPYPHPNDYNAMFVWNHYLLQPATQSLKNTFDWCLPVIHGYIDQAGMKSIIRSS
jgi:hypothetical protein